MIYEELEDAAIKRASVLSERMREGCFHRREFSETLGPRLAAMMRVEEREAEEMGLDPVASPTLHPLLAKVETAHRTMLHARSQNLHSSEYEKTAQRLDDGLVRAAESRWQSEFKAVIGEISRRFESHQAKQAIPSADRLAQESYALQRASILAPSVEPDVAAIRLNDLATDRAPYDPHEAIALAGKLVNGKELLKMVERNTPSYLADPEGVKLLERLERFINHQPGDVVYRYRVRDTEGTRIVEETFNIGETFDAAIAPATEPGPSPLDTSRIPAERARIAERQKEMASAIASDASPRPKRTRREHDDE